MLDLLITNISELATPTGFAAKKGKEQGNIKIINNAAIGVVDGIITFVGSMELAPIAKQTIDAKFKLVTPGLVDSHTHLVFGGWRQHELALKLDGVSYLDILKNGGGILSTVSSTRSASKDELVEKALGLLNEMMAHGTTTCEAKSGYGLSVDEELKELEVTEILQKLSQMEIASTFMGAHAVPNEYKNDRESYINLLCDEMIPLVSKKTNAEFCDIFCETAVFTKEESRRILQKAKDFNFKLKIHADEIDSIGGAELAGELGAISAEHLIQASDAGIRAMAKSETIAVLLPATSFYLEKPFARARKMLDENMAVAIATDFNPGSSPNLNLQFPMNLACLKYKLTPKESLTAVTLNAAAAIDRATTIGSIEINKQADIVIWDAVDLNYLFYRYGSNQVNTVIKKGNIIVQKDL